MSKELERKIENFINKQEKLVGVEELNKMLASSLKKESKQIPISELRDLITQSFLSEAEKPKMLKLLDLLKLRLGKPSFAIKLADMAIKGEDIFIFSGGKPTAVKLSPDFGNQLKNHIKDGTYKQFLSDNENSIKLANNKSIKISDILKATLSGKGDVMTSLSTDKQSDCSFSTSGENFKEGLVCYFYSLLKTGTPQQASAKTVSNSENPDEVITVTEKINEEEKSNNILDLVIEKLKGNKSINLQLPVDVLSTLADKGVEAGLFINAIKCLNGEAQINEDQKKAIFNAVTCAKEIAKLAPPGEYIIDRGVVYKSIRDKAASLLTDKTLVDKWNPSDVYLYKSIKPIQDTLTDFKESQSFVNINKKGKILRGINDIFNESEKNAIGVSLKEDDHIAGKIKSITYFGLKTNNINAKQIDHQVSDESKKYIINISTGELVPKEKIKQYFDNYKKVKNRCLTKLKQYGVDKIAFDPPLSEKDTFLNIPNSADKKYLLSIADTYIKKFECYLFLDYFLDNFESIKKMSSVMNSYDNPLLALVSYGVGLTGFNPTFHKVVGSEIGGEAKRVTFSGQEKISMLVEKEENEIKTQATIEDPSTYKGFKFSYLISMGKDENGKDKIYTTSIVTRFKGGPEMTVEVYEFNQLLPKKK